MTALRKIVQSELAQLRAAGKCEAFDTFCWSVARGIGEDLRGEAPYALTTIPCSLADQVRDLLGELDPEQRHVSRKQS